MYEQCLIATCQWALVAITFILLLARLYIQVYKRFVNSRRLRIYFFCRQTLKSMIPEVFVVIAWISYLITTALQAKRMFMGDYSYRMPQADKYQDENFEYWLKIAVPLRALYYICLYSVKVAMLLFINESLAKTMKKIKIVIKVLGIVLFICFSYNILFICLQCQPISANWTVTPTGTWCTYGSPFTLYTMILPHILTDLAICILPFFPLYKLKTITKKQKTGAFVMFSLGFISVTCAIYSFIAWFGWNGSEEYYLIQVTFVTNFEQATAVAVSCCPAFKAVLVKGWKSFRSKQPHELTEREEVEIYLDHLQVEKSWISSSGDVSKESDQRKDSV